MKFRMLLLILLAMPAFASAADFSYTFVEGAYIDTEVDVGPADIDGDGFGVRGSYAFAPDWYAFASLSDLDFDFNIDGTETEFGVGWHNPLSDRVDLIAEVSYVNFDLDSGFGSADDDGFGLGVGVRALATPQIQVEAGIAYVDLDDSDTAVGFAGRYYFQENLAVGLGVSISDNATGWTLSVRAEF
jgi:hypothetical protein